MDTNILLEVILEQAKAGEVQALLERTDEHELLISDHSLHSIGLLLFRRKQHPISRQLLSDVTDAGMSLAYLGLSDLESVVGAATKFALDFDDAYQYVAAAKHSLTVVSFDADFDRTERGRKTPEEVGGG